MVSELPNDVFNFWSHCDDKPWVIAAIHTTADCLKFLYIAFHLSRLLFCFLPCWTVSSVFPAKGIVPSISPNLSGKGDHCCTGLHLFCSFSLCFYKVVPRWFKVALAFMATSPLSNLTNSSNGISAETVFHTQWQCFDKGGGIGTLSGWNVTSQEVMLYAFIVSSSPTSSAQHKKRE